MQCPDCFSNKIEENGFLMGQKKYICQECHRGFLESTLLKPVSICRHCQREKKIHNQEAWICKSCHESLKKQKKIQEQGKVICSECQELKFSKLYGSNICRKCLTKRNNGYQKCEKCQKIKLIESKKYQLCKLCYSNYVAPNQLKKYIKIYQSPFEYNLYLFNLVTADINWEKVTEAVRRTIFNFGEFLQEQFIPNPITWQIIEELSPEITSINQGKNKAIRACLLRLGHILAYQKKLEPHEEYLGKKLIDTQVKTVSATYQKQLSDYTEYLQESKRTLEDIRHHLQVITNFLEWCQNQQIYSIEIIQPQIIQDYIKQLKSEYFCENCDLAFSCEDTKKEGKGKCPICHQIDSVIKGKKYSTNTIRKHKGKLTVFFDWLKLNRKVIINPVKGITVPYLAKIQHYPEETIYRLFEYTQSETADPTKALILYLIIVHAFSKTELLNAQITAVIPFNSEIAVGTLASIYSVKLPQPSASYGKYSPGRPHTIIHFSQSAKSWLQPLLSRYEEYRNSIVKNPHNPYLFVNSFNALHVKPVGKTFLRYQLRDVTVEVLGTSCCIGLLRKTVAIMYADKTNGSILKQFGWGETQAFFYTWGDRELINFQPLDSSSETVQEE